MSQSESPVEAEAAGAYELLTRDVLTLTDAEVEIIVADLRRKRSIYVNSAGKKADRPDKAPAKAATKTAAQKAEITGSLLAELDLKLGLGDLP